MYVEINGNPALPAIEEIFTMCPKPRDSMPVDIMLYQFVMSSLNETMA